MKLTSLQVLVILPMTSQFQFIINGKSAFRDALKWLKKNKVACSEDKEGQATLLRLCHRVFDLCMGKFRDYSLAYTSYDSCRRGEAAEGRAKTECKQAVVQIALKYGDLQLYDGMVKVLDGEVPVACFRYLGRLLASSAIEFERVRKR